MLEGGKAQVLHVPLPFWVGWPWYIGSLSHSFITMGKSHIREDKCERWFSVSKWSSCLSDLNKACGNAMDAHEAAQMHQNFSQQLLQDHIEACSLPEHNLITVSNLHLLVLGALKAGQRALFSLDIPVRSLFPSVVLLALQNFLLMSSVAGSHFVLGTAATFERKLMYTRV